MLATHTLHALHALHTLPHTLCTLQRQHNEELGLRGQGEVGTFSNPISTGLKLWETGVGALMSMLGQDQDGMESLLDSAVSAALTTIMVERFFPDMRQWYGNPTALQFLRKLGLKAMDLRARARGGAGCGFSFPEVARSHATYEVRNSSASSCLPAGSDELVCKRRTLKRSIEETRRKRETLPILRRAARLLSGVSVAATSD